MTNKELFDYLKQIIIFLANTIKKVYFLINDYDYSILATILNTDVETIEKFDNLISIIISIIKVALVILGIFIGKHIMKNLKNRNRRRYY
jgi:hypothetical protein